MDQGSKALGDGKTGRGFRDLPDQEIEALVQSLSSLREGELGIDMLVALPSINKEIRRRQAASPSVQAADSVLRLLLATRGERNS
ncbi:MAG: hypothetical protein WA609_16590 [Terriglobales bacterium]